jgi:hypothetical protein
MVEMIIPSGVDVVKDSVERIIIALRKAGYSSGAARYLAGKIKGSIKDDNLIQ